MSLPLSSFWEVQQLQHAGRGVIASRAIPHGTVVHESGPPCVHVLFKQYSKETCAQCFLWDRGRALPVRDANVGKVFCSAGCWQDWVAEHGDVGTAAWRVLTAFVRSGKAKGEGGKGDGRGEPMADDGGGGAGAGEGGSRPCAAAIGAAWQRAGSAAKMLHRSRKETGSSRSISKKERKDVQAMLRQIARDRDHEKLSYFLCAALFDHAALPERRDHVLNLAMDDTPYQTQRDLEDSCNAFLALSSIVPLGLVPHLTPELCLNLHRADHHNAFGIRGGGEDGEEYMGYGVYPSASYFNHSCDANIHKKRVGRCWTFYAARDIQPGDELCITYLGGDENGLDLAGRRARLQDVWGFVCHCQRCETESG